MHIYNAQIAPIKVVIVCVCVCVAVAFLVWGCEDLFNNELISIS